MFFWVHGILLGVFMIWVISSVLFEISEYRDNRIVNEISYIDENIPAVIFSIFLGLNVGFCGIITILSATYRQDLLETYDVSDILELSEALQIQYQEYTSKMWNNYFWGYKIAIIIIVLFVLSCFVSWIVKKIQDKPKQKDMEKVLQKQKDMGKIMEVYKTAKNSSSPEMKDVAKVLKATLDKIKLQEEMKDVSEALKAINRIQADKEYLDVQRELDTLSNMIQIDDMNIDNLIKKYNQP